MASYIYLAAITFMANNDPTTGRPNSLRIVFSGRKGGSVGTCVHYHPGLAAEKFRKRAVGERRGE